MWWAAPSPTVGREQNGRRPGVIVSGEAYTMTVNALVLAVPVTSRDRGWPNHVGLHGTHGLAVASWAMTEQVRAISRDRLVTRAGIVTPDCLDEIREWLHDYFAG